VARADEVVLLVEVVGKGRNPMTSIRLSPNTEALLVACIARKAVFSSARIKKISMSLTYSFNQICIKSHIGCATAMVLLGAKLEFPDEKIPAREVSFLVTWAGKTAKGERASEIVPLTNVS
jgi:hypothetical protein